MVLVSEGNSVRAICQINNQRRLNRNEKDDDFSIAQGKVIRVFTAFALSCVNCPINKVNN